VGAQSFHELSHSFEGIVFRTSNLSPTEEVQHSIGSLLVPPAFWQPLDTFDELESQTDREPLRQWDNFGHQFDHQELNRLKNNIAEMALSRIDGQDNLYVGGYVPFWMRVQICSPHHHQ
jgi:hypothetical protein